MIVVSVTYPATEGSRFDLDYYTGKHMPLVRDRWGEFGLEDTKVLSGVGAPGGGTAPYRVVALLTFRSEQDFQRAVQEHGKEVMGDVPNFTDLKPVIQFNEYAQ